MVRLRGLPLEETREKHQQWIRRLLRAGVEMRRIVSQNLDDPRLNERDMEDVFRWATGGA